MNRLRTVALLGILITAGIIGCAGGGSNAPGPDRVPSASAAPNPGGAISVPLDQKAAFTIVIPSPPPATTAGKFKKLSLLYVSPKTGSITLQLQAVNGHPLLNPPPPNAPIPVPSNCPSPCTIPVAGIPAATGVNTFFVQTFVSADGTGAVISAGSILVTLPQSGPAQIPGTTLSLGGYAAKVSLALLPGSPLFQGIPSTSASLAVDAIDPAGAIIIGGESLLNAGNGITLSFPASNQGALTFAGGASTINLQQALNTVPLFYSGASLPTVAVEAKLVDPNGNLVDQTFTIPLPTPVRTQTPSPPPNANGTPYSIYVIDGMGNNVLEFAGVRDIEKGIKPNPRQSPRRVISLAVPLVGGTPNPCTPNGIGVGSDGTMYVATSCQDPGTSGFQVLSYSGSTVQGATSAPATPSSILTLDADSAPYNQPNAVQVDAANHVFVAKNDVNFGLPEIFRFTPSTSLAPDLHIGATCLETLQLGAPSRPCANEDASTTYFSSNPTTSFAVDSSGVVDVGVTYATAAPEPSPSQGPQYQNVIASYDGSASSDSPAPINAISGLPTLLGSGGPLYTIAIDPNPGGGNSLYALSIAYTDGTTSAGLNINAGLSACITPPDTPSASPNCNDGQYHAYVTAYSSTVAQSLDVPTALTGDLGTAPTLILGGDGVSSSTGLAGFNTSYTTGNSFAVLDGFGYFVSQSPPSGAPPEIDIFDLRSLSGVTFLTRPIATISLSNAAGMYALPVGLALGPTGTATGGPVLFSHSIQQIRSLNNARRQERLRSLRMRNAWRSH